MGSLYNWRKACRLKGEVVPAPEKGPEGWCSTDKFTVVLETAGLNGTELCAYSRDQCLYPEQVERWRQASQNANKKPALTLKMQMELEQLRAQDQKEIKRLQQELRRKGKARGMKTIIQKQDKFIKDVKLRGGLYQAIQAMPSTMDDRVADEV